MELAASGIEKLRRRNNARSIHGSACRCWRRRNAAPRQRPVASATTAIGSTPFWAARFSPYDRAEHADQGQGRAGGVDASRAGSPELRQEHTAQRQEHDHRGHGHQEDRAPPEVAQEDAGDQRGDHSSQREARGPDPECGRALTGVAEHDADQRQRRRHERGAREPQQTSRCDQHRRARRERGQHRGQAESGGADQQEPAAADTVAERPHRQQRTGDEERVAVDDPQQLGVGRPEIRRELRNREVEHMGVHRNQQAGQHQKAEPRPFPGSRPLISRRCLV